jgi:hypothetical protein
MYRCAPCLAALAAASIVLVTCAREEGARTSESAGPAGTAGSTDAGSPDPDPAGAARARIGIVFDPGSARVGDSVGVLELASISASRPPATNVMVGTAVFEGELRLTGRTLRHHDHPEVRTVCFEADSASAMTMPRWADDRRRAWFCFSNMERAAAQLAAPGVERAAEIVIDHFSIHRGMSDEVNSARLVRVVRRS